MYAGNNIYKRARVRRRCREEAHFQRDLGRGRTIRHCTSRSFPHHRAGARQRFHAFARPLFILRVRSLRNYRSRSLWHSCPATLSTAIYSRLSAAILFQVSSRRDSSILPFHSISKSPAWPSTFSQSPSLRRYFDELVDESGRIGVRREICTIYWDVLRDAASRRLDRRLE